MGSTAKYEVDLLTGSSEPPDLEELRRSAQETISRRLAEALPQTVEKLISLSQSAEREDVQFRATARILDEFSPKKEPVRFAPQTTVQILNQIPLPEGKWIQGKEQPAVEVAGTKLALPEAPPKQVIWPEEQKPKRASYLGPKHSTTAPSPAPKEFLPKK